jgi:hypothetical protein
MGFGKDAFFLGILCWAHSRDDLLSNFSGADPYFWTPKKTSELFAANNFL